MASFSSRSFSQSFSSQDTSVRGPQVGLLSSSQKGGRRAFSVVGGAGGTGARISSSSASFVKAGIGGGYGSAFGIGGGFVVGFAGGVLAKDRGSLSMNEKETLQNLNERLATYLEKVRSLEKANGQLELQIRQFFEGRTPVAERDLSGYYDEINTLRSKIQEATLDNARLVLQIDNSELAADDFKLKYENELRVRLGVEADNSGLRKVLDELTLSKSNLEMQIEGLQEEVIHLKKNHEEEQANLRSQLGGSVSVELDSTPGIDLTQIMADMREQYEEMIKKNREEVEAWHTAQSEALNREVATHTEAIQTSKGTITDLRRSIQGLEIEMQSGISMIGSLESTRSETETRYAIQLQQLQDSISRLEAGLFQVRADASRQAIEYTQLLDVKNRLEAEIATYRHLLDDEDSSKSSVYELQKVSSIISSRGKSSGRPY
ncbi:keratin, type I cytoskeletal 19 [Microcaecilia unicolor]|uniref:Keratin, type I cytoskeletal 19-like n=1 Tax=Microcaecilia unicolor TaxID=1415580 RepID=A0A6P7ZUU2_9AMPH|nr:keratin, type I cytoskeletal 19-like [Microcaecilia unicolor]